MQSIGLFGKLIIYTRLGCRTWAYLGGGLRAQTLHPNELFTVINPKTVVKCNQIQSNPPNPTPHPFFSGYAPPAEHLFRNSAYTNPLYVHRRYVHTKYLT